MKNDFCILIASPPGYIHARCFEEVALSLHEAFRELGYNAPVITNPDFITGTPIVLGATLLRNIPHVTLAQPIIYNLEQIDIGSTWITDDYINLLKSHIVWDYSKNNISKLAEMGIKAKFCGIGYTKSLTKIPSAQEDIDVLFVGSLNERRNSIINELRANDIKVETAFGLYGNERDSLVARAKIILNVHFYEAKVFEIVRCSYMLANKKCIVSEEGSDRDLELPYAQGIFFTPYNKIVNKCLSLLVSPNARKHVAEQGYNVFSGQPQAEFLRNVLC